MKKIQKSNTEKITGGVSARTCLISGWSTVMFLGVGRLDFAVGAYFTGIGAGCVDD